SEGEREEIRRGMDAVEARIAADMDPLMAASRMDVDEVVLPGELRGRLETAIEVCYQACGYRRVKNPRIWSLHDLAVLDEGGGRASSTGSGAGSTCWFPEGSKDASSRCESTIVRRPSRTLSRSSSSIQRSLARTPARNPGRQELRRAMGPPEPEPEPGPRQA